MLGSLEADGSTPEGVDQCHGHAGETEYDESCHYHASADFPNLPPCLAGVVAQDNFSTTACAGIGSPGAAGPGWDGGMPPELEEAAHTLGVTAEALLNALDRPGQRPDFAAAAAKLGVTEDALRSVLPARR
ncbi:MAG: hypothetical protein DWQ08_04415 [Proteobacteria bacterium]|nr:MAG: hypothetical protein DWQ08_04415 [Pseudomonadota bacterium]